MTLWRAETHNEDEACPACCRPAYDRLIRELGIRPLKVQAGRNLVIRLTEVGAVKSVF